MDLTAEQIDKVAGFSGVSRDAARAALEEAGGCSLDAVLLLERQGKAPPTPGGAWSTRCGAEAAALPVRAAGTLAPRKRPARRRYTAKEVGDVVKDFVRNCTKVSVDIWRGEDLLVGIPLVVCVILFIMFYWIMVPLAALGLALRCRYHISGWEGNADVVNRTMDRVTDTVAGWAVRLRDKLAAQHGGKKGRTD